MCAPSRHLRSAGHCSPVSGTPGDTPGHLWILSDRRHAPDLKVRTQKRNVDESKIRWKSKFLRKMNHHIQKCRKISSKHTHTQKWKQMEQKQGHGKKPEREQGRERDGIMLDYLPSGQNDPLKDCSFFSSCEWRKGEKQKTYAASLL